MAFRSTALERVLHLVNVTQKSEGQSTVSQQLGQQPSCHQLSLALMIPLQHSCTVLYCDKINSTQKSLLTQTFFGGKNLLVRWSQKIKISVTFKKLNINSLIFIEM